MTDEAAKDPQEPARPGNPFAGASVGLALFALFLGSIDRLGATLGVVAIAFGTCGVLRAEKSDSGLPASLFGVVLGLLAVFWAAASFASSH